MSIKNSSLFICCMAAASLIILIFASPAFGEAFCAGDGHVHTKMSGEVALTTGATIEGWTEIANNKGLDWISITDHSDLVLYNAFFKDELTLAEWSYLLSETSKNWSIPVLLGEEVTLGNGYDMSTQGHLLTYGIREPIQVFNRPISPSWDKGPRPDYRRDGNALISDIRGQHSFGFIAHPYKSADTWRQWDNVVNNLDVIKGMELFSAGKFQGEAALKKWQGFLKQQKSFWVVGNSDSHNIKQFIPPFMGSSLTYLTANSNSEDDILNALKNGRATASNGPGLSMTINGKYPGDRIKNVSIGSKLAINTSWSSTAEHGNPIRLRLYDQTQGLTGEGTVFNISGLSGSKTIDYEVKGKGYVLAKVETDNGKMAYTNPIFISPTNAQKKSRTSTSVALLIDCSGSMQWNDPHDLRKDAAKCFIDLAQPGDKIAVIGFNSYLYEFSTLREIKDDSDKQALKRAVDYVRAGGSTNINGALSYGHWVLGGDTSSNKKAAILLTDGGHDYGYYGNSHLLFKNKGWNVFTIGLGDSADSKLLTRIAVDTGGTYYKTYKPEGMLAIYSQLSQVVRGAAPIEGFNTNIKMGQIIDKAVHIGSNNMQATFSTIWRGSDVALTLIAPDGSIIDSTTIDPDVEHMKASTYEAYNVDNPTPGDWTLRMEGIDIPQGGEDVDIDVSGVAETPPLVEMMSPQDRAVIKGETTITVEANDNEGLEDFGLYVGGDLLAASETTGTKQASITCPWNTKDIPDGYYYIAGIAFDPNSSSGQDGITLIVDNTLPVADAGADQRAREGEEVIFNASNSKDVDWFGYYWDFGDGTTETAAGPLITHTYSRHGRYIAMLTVNDAAGNIATDTISVKVLPGKGISINPPGQDDEPSRPQGIKYNLSDDMIHLVWNPSKDANVTGYNVYRSVEGGQLVKLNADLINEVQYQDRDVQVGQLYTYYVTAQTDVGDESKPSTIEVAYTKK